MKHFLTTEHWSRPDLQGFLDTAARFRDGERSASLAGKSVALVFFNPSLRTRASFQIGVGRLGGQAIVLEPGVSSWPIEPREGVVMDADAEEHAKEAAQVLSRYFDMIAIRAFPKFKDWSSDLSDPILSAFVKWSRVPIVNMETIVHPCQELALMRTIQDKIGVTDGKIFTLTWVPHPRPLNTAVANSALMIAAKFGFEVRLCVPDEAYRLDPRFMADAEASCAAHGRSLTVMTDPAAAYAGAHVVYGKSWGALPYFGRFEDEQALRRERNAARFIIDEAKLALTDDAIVSHCLPMRRNVKMTDAVADSAAFVGIDEAENRLWVQMAVLDGLARGSSA